MTNWGFIGCGNLSQAIILGALKEKLFKPKSVFVSNRTASKSKIFSKKTKVQVAPSNKDLIQKCNIIFVGTKPFDIIEVLTELGQSQIKNKIIVSLAAGVESFVLKKYCSQARSVIRVMANTPVSIQSGFFGVLPVKSQASDLRMILNFLNHLGGSIIVKNDSEINTITAGSASGVGFIFSFMEEFEKWFRKRGLDSKQSRSATVLTFLGASELAKNHLESPLSELRDRVTSKKGTTYEGLKALQRNRVGPGLRSGLDASFKRANELAKSLRQNQK
jgi:pyrroline-5-carboxylate reductase